jgi:hypothetical protein
MQGFTKNNTEFTIADSANLDAFSRLRVSSPQSLFSVQCQYNSSPIIMESGNTGTGVLPAHDANTRMVKLSCTAGSGTSFFQSYQYIPYQPSKSQQIFVTGLLGAAVAGAVVDVGYFDANNGIFLRQDGTNGLKFVRRTSTSGSVVNNEVAQSSWNIDKLDGTGASGITLDVTKVYILCIDLQFLAMGRIRIGFDIDGLLIYAHEFLNANILTVPYMQTATLPVQMLLTATSTGSTKDCYFKCAAVNAEGGDVLFDDFSFAHSVPDTTVTAGSGTRTHLVSLRPKTTFNSITNRELLLLDNVEIYVSGTNAVFWELCIGQAITTPTWADVNTAYSGFEYGTGTISGAAAVTIASGYIASGATVKQSVSRAIASRYPITLDRAGAVRANGTLSLVVTGLGGTSATRAVIGFREIR